MVRWRSLYSSMSRLTNFGGTYAAAATSSGRRLAATRSTACVVGPQVDLAGDRRRLHRHVVDVVAGQQLEGRAARRRVASSSPSTSSPRRLALTSNPPSSRARRCRPERGVGAVDDEGPHEGADRRRASGMHEPGHGPSTAMRPSRSSDPIDRRRGTTAAGPPPPAQLLGGGVMPSRDAAPGRRTPS